ncbi:MAG: adenosylmethionine decarboxylase [bacterium]|nr:adenosylmethionine decarboxylase [bacterium]
MKALGQQLLVELYHCDPEILNDVNAIESHMEQAAEIAGATIVEKTFHHFSPHGVSGVVVIAESHLAIHTWPEYGYAAVDLFTCGDTILPEPCFHYLQAALKSKSFSITEMKRGILSNVGVTEFTHKPQQVGDKHE